MSYAGVLCWDNSMFNETDWEQKEEALLSQQWKINMVMPHNIKSHIYFLGICEVITKHLIFPCATSYGSEPAFPPLLWTATTGLFTRVLGFYTMNQRSSDTIDVHTTEVIMTARCQTSYCSQKYTAAIKEN